MTPLSLASALVVGISSRTLFDLEMEDQLFEKNRREFFEYQRKQEDVIMRPGTAFPLVQALLRLNPTGPPRRVEVMILSKNHPDVYLRVRHSIKHYGLDITRAFLTGGDPIAPLLAAYKFDLFLSAEDGDVREAVNQGFAAGRIYTPPEELPKRNDKIRIALDGDCVVFGDEAERINSTAGLEAFLDHERQNANVPLPDGPFANFLRKLAQMQGPDEEISPFRIGLVTARNAPADERPLKTFRAWGVRFDNAAFLGGLPKDGWLTAFQPHIFFDDQEIWCTTAARVSPTAIVPRRDSRSESRARFLLICRGYLGGDSELPVFEKWYADHPAIERVSEGFLNELAQSANGTPSAGEARPLRAKEQTPGARLLVFVSDLLEKHASERAEHDGSAR
jgi:5'-nucleotidase